MSVDGEKSGTLPAPSAVPGNPLMSAPNSTASATPAPQQMAAAQTKSDETGMEDQAWIDKAKTVIARSHGDPFVRHDAMNQLKYQYLKQRFGKDIGGSQD